MIQLITFDQALNLRNHIREHGGFTYDPRNDEFFTGQGFAVSVKGNERIISGIPFAVDFVAYSIMHSEILNMADHYLGGWLYEGNTYLDISIVLSDFDIAVHTAREHGEIAVYDLGNNEEYKV